jgi:hypothetical protein
MDGNKLEMFSLHLVPFTFMKLLTLVRNPMYVNNVGNSSLMCGTFDVMKEITV